MNTRSVTRHIFALTMALGFGTNVSAQDFKLNEHGYFQASGINVMAFDDIYPEGHQGGVALIMNGQRVATNGDLRLEATPGQWQPVPKQLTRKVFIERLRVYGMVENLVTWTKYWGFDPEISSAGTSCGMDFGVYPQPRTIKVGLNVTF